MQASSLLTSFKEHLPGIALCLGLAFLVTALAAHYDAPVMLFALLFGLSLHFLEQHKRFHCGIAFTSKTGLRVGVALLGMRITLTDMQAIGFPVLAMVTIGLISTIALGLLLAKFLKKNNAFALLTAGAVSICGASAALAISTILPARDPSKPDQASKGICEQDVIFTVVGVTALGTIAMIFYPLAMTYFGFDPQIAGIFIGAAIHDVAQAVGAGYSLSPETGDIATITKLLRVMLLVPFIAIFALVYWAERKKPVKQAEANTSPVFPTFLLGFMACVLLNSFGWVPNEVATALTFTSRELLIAAIAALGLKTSLKDFFQLGFPGLALIVAESVWIAIYSLGALLLFF